MQKPFIVNTESFELLRDEVSIGTIKSLSSSDASLVAKHLEHNPHTLYIASSGVNVAGTIGSVSLPQQQMIAIEWVRKEPHPQPTEPEYNMNRYLFGISDDGKCYGYQEWDYTSTPDNLQVGDHWMSFESVFQNYFG